MVYFFFYFIDTEIVEKPIFVNLTRVFREPIQQRCMRVNISFSFKIKYLMK